ncbi:hypothetical protein GCM10025868_09270 [Angustibacter aerolatus]|uniref:Uncharacterized protein n=1 Tax=Angustibacter aerolatus TaxID=1162965 RepID=A0ABQ6JBY5_9ACTN|nr:hypothetical protein GCM10025868_09270 [Angustibacter aerolatus]
MRAVGPHHVPRPDGAGVRRVVVVARPSRHRHPRVVLVQRDDLVAAQHLRTLGARAVLERLVDLGLRQHHDEGEAGGQAR